jgi:hypothetical protein
LSFTKELAVKYTQDFFVQTFSLANIFAGLFSVYDVFFDVEGERYQIVKNETDKDIGIEFSVVQLINPLSLEMIRRRLSVEPETRAIHGPVLYWEISAGQSSITFGERTFSPISDLSLLNVYARLANKK